MALLKIGWVYLIANKAMPGLVKVGYTTRSPATRAQELAGTGSPHRFEVRHQRQVVNPAEVELRVHAALNHRREGKEWFRCSEDEAVATLDRFTQAARPENYPPELLHHTGFAPLKKLRRK
jgi:hypothetical protein